jgi:uncharacterized Zn finger protein (UPF0148 family)
MSTFYTRMNDKLDNGWKMTTLPCDACKTNWLIEPKTKYLYCAKCDVKTKEPAEIVMEDE